MIGLLYCPELNIYRMTDVFNRFQPKVWTREKLEEVAAESEAPWLIRCADDCMAAPNQKIIIAF